MTIAQCIAISSRPDTHIVLGVRLRPFCIGHWISLTGADVSFISGANHSLADLIFAVLVCSESHDGFYSTVDAGGFEKSVSGWGKSLSGGILGRLGRTVKRLFGVRVKSSDISGFDFEAECNKFQAYLDEMGASENIVNDWARPITKSIIKSSLPGRSLDSPEMFLILNALTSELGIQEREALNMPLPLARWKIAVHAEQRGMVSIKTLYTVRERQSEANEIARRFESGELKIS